MRFLDGLLYRISTVSILVHFDEFFMKICWYSGLSLFVILSSIKQDIGILSNDLLLINFSHVAVIVTIPLLHLGVVAVSDVMAEVEAALVICSRIELILVAILSMRTFHILLHVNLKRKIDHIVDLAVHLHPLQGENHNWTQSNDFLLLFDCLQILAFPAVITCTFFINGLFFSKDVNTVMMIHISILHRLLSLNTDRYDIHELESVLSISTFFASN